MTHWAQQECFVHQGNDPPHYLHATKLQKDYWNGSNIQFRTKWCAFHQSTSLASTHYFTLQKWVTKGNIGDTLSALNSEYETKIYCTLSDSVHNDSLPVRDTCLHEYEWINSSTVYYSDRSTQMNIERLIYKYYYKNPTLFYSSKPWWANLWVQADGFKFYDSVLQTTEDDQKQEKKID